MLFCFSLYLSKPLTSEHGSLHIY
uniref:Uncharacterized protein n=1 Tax=Heterorhabditis bacteriophora TaxID=37862 RepID=A0A1I7X5N2_HETBA